MFFLKLEDLLAVVGNVKKFNIHSLWPSAVPAVGIVICEDRSISTI